MLEDADLDAAGNDMATYNEQHSALFLDVLLTPKEGCYTYFAAGAFFFHVCSLAFTAVEFGVLKPISSVGGRLPRISSARRL